MENIVSIRMFANIKIMIWVIFVIGIVFYLFKPWQLFSHVLLFNALFMHIRLPAPLGMVPPLLDASIGALISSISTPLAILSTLIYFYSYSVVWCAIALLLFAKCLRSQSSGLTTPSERYSDLKIVDSPVPFALKVHPYLLEWMGKFLSNDIVVESMNYDPSHIRVDVWCRANKTPEEKSKMPVVFFVHGGGWLGGSSRRHTQSRLLFHLAHDFLIVAVNYRKSMWPQHLDDCFNAFQWAKSEPKVGGDWKKTCLIGASAGGHLVVLLQIKLLMLQNQDQTSLLRQNSAMLSENSANIQSMILFYPAVDPLDDSKATVTFPVDIPWLKISRGQSLMAWYFEMFVLRGDRSKWFSALPIQQLLDSNSHELLSSFFPKVLIFHGSLDAVVPVEHSVAFLDALASSSCTLHKSPTGTSCQRRRPGDELHIINGHKHCFDANYSEDVIQRISSTLHYTLLERDQPIK